MTLPHAALAAGLAAVLMSPAPAQPPAKPLAFEVASIKPAAPCCKDGESRGSNIEADRIDFEYATLRYCIGWAYGVKDFQIAAPARVGELRYDIVAKGPAATRESQLREMLQTLLKERFRLELHRETREASGFALVVARNGPKLQDAKADPADRGHYNVGASPGAGGNLEAKGVPMAQLASILSNLLGRPVADLTQLTGAYDFSLSYAHNDSRGDLMVITVNGAPPPESAEPGTSVFNSIQELGLKLEARKVPLETIVVDRAEKVPVEN